MVTTLLEKDKQYKIFKKLLDAFNNIAKAGYRCTPKNYGFFHKQADSLKTAYVDSRYLLLAKRKDITTLEIEDTLQVLLEEICKASSLLSILKVDQRIIDKLKHEIPDIERVVKDIEDFRVKYCEEKRELSKMLREIHEKIKQLLQTIENKINNNPEKYNNYIRVVVENNIINEIIFKADRPAFFSATRASLEAERTYTEKEDIRHWKSNEIMKQEIKHMFEGQPFDLVAEHLVEKGHSKQIKDVCSLQDALFRLWQDKFNEKSNLRIGPSQPNQALGRLIRTLKPKLTQGKENFVPFTLDLKKFGFSMQINDWETLKDLYFNANFDFKFDNSSMPEQLHQAASEFVFTYKR